MIYKSESRDMTMLMTGDTMLSRRLSPFREPAYLSLVDRVRRADFSFTNLETTVRHAEQGFPVSTQGTPMATHPDLLRELSWMGFDAVSTANNHATDFGVGGVLSTIGHLTSAGIPFAGTGANLAEARRPCYVDTPAGRVALLAANAFFSAGSQASEQRRDFIGRPGINPLGFSTTYVVDQATLEALRAASLGLGMGQQRRRLRALFFSDDEMPADSETSLPFLEGMFEAGDGFSIRTVPSPKDRRDIVKSIEEARRQADWVVFSLHYHEMGEAGRLDGRKMTDVEEPAPFVVEMARAAADAGADLVVGHGPHVTLGMEIYKGVPIFYSLGNFILQNDTVEHIPDESYARFGLPGDAGPADFFDARTRGDTRGFPASPEYWESVAAEVAFSGGALREIRLVPLDLGFGRSRAQRGRPVVGDGTARENAIERVRRLSARYHGTSINPDGTISFS